MPQLHEISGPLQLTIVRRIATGGMGHVYQAIQSGVEGFSKTVAVKTILPRFSQDQEFVRMFIGEAKLVADLVHQNIVQVYHLGRARGLLYIVMEYVDGVTLKDFIERHAAMRRPIPVELAAFIASRVSRGLEYAHKKTALDGTPLGIVHRDISPRNLLITQLGEVKIGDFGIAQARNVTLGREGRRMLGKYAYISPEQARFEPTDNRSDLFSLGIVLWEMLAGRRPLDGRAATRTTWLEQVRSTPLPPLRPHAPTVPPALAAIVDRAVAHDVGARYQDAGQMGYDLEYFMYHKGYGPTIVTLESYLAKLLPGGKRRRSWGRKTGEKTASSTLTDTTRIEPRRRRRMG